MRQTSERTQVSEHSKKDLEGEQSPRKNRAVRDWQRSRVEPDLTAEQSLEAEEPADRLSKPGTGNGNWRREREGRGQRQGGNGHSDVVRLRCGRFFEGCETAS